MLLFRLKSVIPFLDGLEDLASKAQSVNTAYKKENKIIGANTDINGFINALNHIKYNVMEKGFSFRCWRSDFFNYFSFGAHESFKYYVKQ